LRSSADAGEDPSLLGSIDQPAEGAVFRGAFVVRGWARMTGDDLGLAFTIDGRERQPLSLRREPRPDVCAVFSNLAPCDSAGYEARFDLSDMEPGRHELTAIFRTKDGRRERHYQARRFTWAH
jgi:hypothetical protein